MTTQTSSVSAAPAAGPLAGWIEVFKAGTHTDSAGKRFSFGVSDLDQMAANHALGAAPAVLGHPKHDDPAYAWVDGIKREGGSLYAQFRDVNPDFAAGVQKGAYRNRSVSVYKDADAGWRVRHVGWLGAMPPAIDGLKPVNFVADDAACLEFSAPGYSLVWGLENVARLLRGLRDQMIAKDGLDAADAALPQYQIDGAMEAAAQARQEFQAERLEDAAEGETPAVPTSYSQTTGGAMLITQAQLDAATEAATAARAEADAAKADFARASGELVSLRSAAQKERITAQVDKWKAEGRLYAHEGEGLVEFMVSLDALSAVEFSFGKAEGGEAKLTPLQYHQAKMEARTPLIKLGYRSAAGDAASAPDLQDPSALASAAQEYTKAQATKGVTVAIHDAIAHVAARN